TMGVYYAKAAGLPEAVAMACKAHYQPLGPSDDVPTDPVSVAVALADKIDTLTGFWAIDEKPTGSKDPFALRRAALGVIRLVLGNGVRIGLARWLVRSEVNLRTAIIRATNFESFEREDELAVALMQVAGLSKELAEEKAADLMDERVGREAAIQALEEKLGIAGKDIEARTTAELLAFFHDRLKVHLRDEGIRHDVIDASLAMPGNDDLTLLVRRAEALAAFLKTDDGENLLQGFKRANNILTQAEARDGVEYSFGADPKFAEGEAERTLFAALDTAEAAIDPAMKAEDFAAAMSAMAALRAPIDAFFEAVQVNTDNAVVRRNRLNLLSRIRQICLSVADLTKLEG
ncbi:MAG: glycine--tRNA ligase subunit beta, partial [Rhodobacteraceae bacterium]|nr:glycine--tRNA ligase subunit beta [Paracoccaceae bacterium]